MNPTGPNDELPDECVFQITQILYNEFKDELNAKKLDENNIDQFKRNFIKPLYPHKPITGDMVEKYSCDEYCCELDPGRFLCCDTKPPDDQYRDFGLGVCLYVKFLKHLTCFLGFVSILAIVAVGLYYVVSIDLSYPILETYQNFIFAGTTGIMASQFSKCEYSAIDTSSGFTADFSISCAQGEINYLGLAFSNQTLNNLANCRSQIDKVIAETYTPSGLTTTSQDCSADNSECSLSFSFSTNVNNGYQYEYIAYTYECLDSSYPLGNLELSSAVVTYIVFGIDFGILIFFVFYLCSEDKAEEKEQFYFKNKELAINDFTIKLQGFTLRNIQNELDYFIKGFHNNGEEEYGEGEGLFSNIVQIKVPETVEVREAIQRRREAYQSLYQLIDICFFEEMVDINNYSDSQDFITKCYGTADSEEYKEYKRLIKQGVEEFLESKKMGKGNISQNYQKSIPVSVFMVLSNPRFKRKILKKAKNQCFKKKLIVSNRQYTVSEPPVADMIIWENLHKWTCCRVLAVWIITLCICFCSYLLVGIAQFKKNQLVSNNNFGQDCDVIYTDQEMSTYDESLSSLQSEYFNCYCDYNKFNTQILGGQCYSWAVAYGTYLAIPILISLGIVLYNLIVSRIFRLMTKFQGHSDITTELYSYIIKRSFVLIMNMGLIMILLKLDYDPSGDSLKTTSDLYFLFEGTYTDITADWYLEIGVIITLTLSFNIFIPFFEMLLLSFLKCLRKCWDRRCYTRRTSQKTKKAYLELYTNDVFPIEERYADLIAIIIITLAFSGVMPGLYVISFFSFLFMMLSDKLLLFRVYQKPINYTSGLQNKVFKTLYVGLMIHCVVTIFLLSEPHLVASGTIYTLSILKISNQRLNPIIQEPYLIAYLVLLLLLLLYGILHSTLISLFKYCAQKCKKNMSRINRRKLNQNFYETLNDYQINRLKMSIEKQLNKNISHTISSIRSNRNIEETQINLKEEKKHLSELISQNTLKKLEDLEQAKKEERNRPGGKARETLAKTSNARLIGHAGYEEMFDDEVFYRERKIKSLDVHLGDILGRNYDSQRPKSQRSKVLEITELEI